ncbi:MAG: hypothetical protein ACP5RH_17180 [Leptodesmis sp.]
MEFAENNEDNQVQELKDYRSTLQPSLMGRNWAIAIGINDYRGNCLLVRREYRPPLWWRMKGEAMTR